MVENRTLRWVALAIALVAAAPVHAQDTDEDRARAHFSAARAYFEQGRYLDAAREFEESYRLSPRAELLDNAARAYERAHECQRAIGVLERLRESQPENARTIGDRIDALAHLCDDDHAAAVETPATSPPATGGYISMPGLITLIGGGVVGLGALITGIVSFAMLGSVNAACTDGVCPTDQRGAASTGEALGVTSTVLTFVAAAAIGAGIIALLLDTGPHPAAGARLEWAPGPGDVGLGARVRF